MDRFLCYGITLGNAPQYLRERFKTVYKFNDCLSYQRFSQLKHQLPEHLFVQKVYKSTNYFREDFRRSSQWRYRLQLKHLDRKI